jgi:hypothetical protein
LITFGTLRRRLMFEGNDAALFDHFSTVAKWVHPWLRRHHVHLLPPR